MRQPRTLKVLQTVVCVAMSAVAVLQVDAEVKRAGADRDERATGSDDEEKKEPQVIRQGGYVERVDPNVDYKDRMTRIPPHDPADALETFQLIAGLQLEQVAAEPLVKDAVDLAFDEDGFLYVVEMTTYSEAGHTRSGHVSRLEDRDGDGRFDSSVVYVDGLEWPTGIACFDGGVFVASAPDILYCKDTDGDGRADLREVYVSGFETSNPNAFPNSLRWGLDGRIHGMSSTAGGELRAVKWLGDDAERAAAPIQCRGRDFSFHPRTGELRLESGGSQFGLAYDVWQRKFESSNSVPIEMVMYDDRSIARNPFLVAPSPRVSIRKGANRIFRTSPVEPWRAIRTEMRIAGSFSGPVEGGGTPAGYFTAACGVTIYTGDAWPEEFHGNAFVCEGAGNLVHRMRLQPDGLGFTAHRVEEGREFLASSDVWFRPVQLANAPDGNLYMADMYREIFEHPDAVPPSVKKYIDLNAGNDRGRIYRIVPQGSRQRRRVRLGDLGTTDLVALLTHRNGWHRRTASRLLYERQDAAAVESLVSLAKASEFPPGRMHALHALAAQEALAPDMVLTALADTHARVREHAVSLAEPLLPESPELRARLIAMVGDSDARVRYQLAFTLGEVKGVKATAALATLAKRDTRDAWSRLAVLSSSLGRAGDLFRELAFDSAWRQRRECRSFLEAVAEQVGLQAQGDQVAVSIQAIQALPAEERDLRQASVRGLSRGLEKSGSPLRDRLASADLGSVLAKLMAQAKAAAGDASLPLERRVEAIRSLALAPFEDVSAALEKWLDGREPNTVQTAAIQTLGRFQQEEVAVALLEAWSGFSPAVRAEATEVLFARRDRLLKFLSAVEEGSINPSEIDQVRVSFLRSHPDKELADRAAGLFADVQLARRQDVIARYQDVLERDGDPRQGKEVFRRECSTCHRLEGVGFDLGLPLSSVKNRGAETILLSILDPNREINPQYLNYIVVTNDAQTITGIITAETATSVTLERAEGAKDTLLRTDMQLFQKTELSIMPEGLEEKLTRQELADVIAYLLSF